jgi:hypothetical protein
MEAQAVGGVNKKRSCECDHEHVWLTGACLGPVRSEPVQNGFSKMMAPPNLEPD